MQVALDGESLWHSQVFQDRLLREGRFGIRPSTFDLLLLVLDERMTVLHLVVEWPDSQQVAGSHPSVAQQVMFAQYWRGMCDSFKNQPTLNKTQYWLG